MYDCQSINEYCIQSDAQNCESSDCCEVLTVSYEPDLKFLTEFRCVCRLRENYKEAIPLVYVQFTFLQLSQIDANTLRMGVFEQTQTLCSNGNTFYYLFYMCRWWSQISRGDRKRYVLDCLGCNIEKSWRGNKQFAIDRKHPFATDLRVCDDLRLNKMQPYMYAMITTF